MTFMKLQSAFMLALGQICRFFSRCLTIFPALSFLEKLNPKKGKFVNSHSKLQCARQLTEQMRCTLMCAILLKNIFL